MTPAEPYQEGSHSPKKRRRPRFIKRITGSVFTKLLLVIIFTGVGLNVMLGSAFHHISKTLAQSAVKKNIVQYINYIVADMGTPPILERARVLAERSALQISYLGDSERWTTGQRFPRFKQRRFRPWFESPGMSIGRFRGFHLILVETESGRLIFKLSHDAARDINFPRLVVMLLLFSTLLLTSAYFLIRRILRPVRWLSTGVDAVSRGQLNHRVPTGGTDEFRSLAESFNEMTHRIRNMLSAKERLLLDVSHELRSPLTRMKVALEFLPDGQAKKTVAEDVTEMEQMVSGILTSARMRREQGPLEKQRVDLGNLIRSVCRGFEGQKPGIDPDLPSRPVHLAVDPEQIKTVLNNVLENALKFSEPESLPVSVSLLEEEHRITVRITDDGVGIPEEDLAYIFEPFYRVDKSRSKQTGGFGLGLSICQGIMNAHKGRIEIASKAGQGTTVRLHLPRSGPE